MLRSKAIGYRGAATRLPDNLFFEILTYHEFGKEKYTKLGLEYSVTDGYVSDDDVKILLTELKNRSLKVINT